MCSKIVVEQLFAGKPQAFGPKQSPSSIIKTQFTSLQVKVDGAIEDEQGNKKLHGGPFMALHQFAQPSYAKLALAFEGIANQLLIGSIGENISTASMQEDSVFIGDEYAVGSTLLKVVSPRAPCAKINHRYATPKVDLFIAQHGLTGWYYSVVKEGEISVGDQMTLQYRNESAQSIKQIWQLRQLTRPTQSSKTWLDMANYAFQDPNLAPEWQAHMHRVSVQLAKLV